MGSNDAAALPLIGLLGAGRMGRGIAVAFAHVGIPTVLIDLKDRSADDLERLRSDVEREINGT